MSKNDELVVVRASDLAALQAAVASLDHTADTEACEPGDFVGQTEFLDALRKRSTDLRFKPVVDCLRRVEPSDGDGNDPALVIMPPDVDSARATELVNAAVQYTDSLTADGEGLAYFEHLEEELAKSGIIITQAMDRLHCQPWDRSNNPAEPNDVLDDDPQWVKVHVSGSSFQDSDTEWEMTLVDGTDVDFVEGHQAFIGFVKDLTYNFPRSDRYGVPEEATDRGARGFVVGELGFACSRDFEVMANDTGDDTPSRFEADCIMPRDILVPLQRPLESERG